MRREGRERGQILVVFSVAVVVLLTLAGLVFDGAQALVLRRKLQNAGDAGALAAANLIQTGSPKGCSAAAGSPPGAPRLTLVTAATAAVQANLPGFPADRVVVSCPDGWSNYAVAVGLRGVSPGFFGGIVGMNGLPVATVSEAVNGQAPQTKYSIVLLDPANPAWPNGRRGCPSFLISGGPTLVLEGSAMLNSACPATAGGPMGTNGNSATVSLLFGSTIRMVGEYVPATLAITPTPLDRQKAYKDPLAGLSPVPVASLPVQRTSKLVLSGGTTVLEPGVYRGGIQMKNTAKAFLHPGIYVLSGGGFDIGAQNAVYSIAAGKSSTTDATWGSDCPAATCGVLLYNTGISGSTDQLSVGAGATMKLRPYKPTADATGLNETAYENILVWQDGAPAASSSFAQPAVYLNGGGNVDLSGTVYAPSALVHMGGGSGGSGGTATDLTLQFIAWDLELQGNSKFRFYYRSDAFARPTDYGLIK